MAGKTSANSDDGSPSDADPEISKVPFDLQLATAVRGAKSIADLQRVFSSDGRVTERNGDRVSYDWTCEEPDGAEDYMLVNVQGDGSFGGGILNRERGQNAINSFGGFVCDTCQPPILHCSARPSWVDAADCTCVD